ncbi:MAG TPA: hypothetical protein VF796_09310 [Humisphaera sp.]
MEELLIAAVSCERYAERREACRRSWLSAAQDAAAHVVFVVGAPGAPSARLGGDTLYVPCADDYASLPQKTRLAAAWAVRRGFRRLFKCDDDTFVHVPRLVAAAPGLAPFTGFVHPSGSVSGGAGYLLGGDALGRVAAADGRLGRGAEDVLVTQLLRDAGIAAVHDARFCPGNRTVPTVFNAAITAHYVDPPAMVALHESLEQPPPSLFRLLGAEAGYGAVGVGGFRGFSANGSARPRLPVDARGPGDEVVSAHAPSSVRVHLGRPVQVRGWLDDDAGPGGSPVSFWVDGQECGTAAAAGQRTAWRRVPAGEHELRATVGGGNTSRYAVWQLREEPPAPAPADLAASDAATAEQPLVTVTSWSTGFGTLGLGGDRGHAVGDDRRVAPPADHEDWTRYQLFSGHADFDAEVHLARPAAVVGFMDAETWFRPAEPIRFVADERDLDLLYAGGQRTREVRLPPGRHRLTAARDNPCDITRKYPVWAIRPFDPASPMRIVIPTSDRHTRAAAASLTLLDRYWPDHPPVDVVRHDVAVAAPASVRQLYAGPQADVQWSTALRQYLEQHNRDELVLLMLDDYGLCQPARGDLIDRARQIMMTDLTICRFHLTWMMLPSRTPHAADGVIVGPPWTYTVNLQAAIWRRSTLLRVLRAVGPAFCDDVELRGSAYVNDHERAFETEVYYDLPTPPVPSLMLDSTDKQHWPLAYHNLMYRGNADQRHEPFLRREGLSLAP